MSGRKSHKGARHQDMLTDRHSQRTYFRLEACERLDVLIEFELPALVGPYGRLEQCLTARPQAPCPCLATLQHSEGPRPAFLV
jgi:hypothetical protein